MVLCQLHQDLSSISHHSNAVDWSEYSRTMPPDTIRESAKWIKTTKAASNDLGSMPIPRAPVNISTLNTEQSIAYTIVQQHCYNLSTNQQSSTPLRMIVCGTAGTGKSYLINAIVQCLEARQSYCIRNNRNGCLSHMWCNNIFSSTVTYSLI